MSSSAEKYSKRGVRTSYVSTVIGISLVLFVISIIVGGSFALNSIQKQAKESLQADIFFKPEYGDADIKQIEQELRSWQYFKQVKYVDSDQAINEIKGLDQDPSDILGILNGDIAIPTNISFHPKEEYADLEGMKKIKSELLAAYPDEIDEVHYSEESVSDVNLGFKRFVYLFGFIAMLLVVVAIAMINNLGPALGNFGPVDNYASLGDFQTWLCSFAMLLGRLEMFTILVLFTPAFWRK